MKKKSLVHTLYLLGLAGAFVGLVLLIMGLVGNPQVINSAVIWKAHVTSPTLYFLGWALMIVAAMLVVVAWVSALVATGRRGQWGWFIALILLAPLSLLVYIFVEQGTPAHRGQYAARG